LAYIRDQLGLHSIKLTEDIMGTWSPERIGRQWTGWTTPPDATYAQPLHLRRESVMSQEETHVAGMIPRVYDRQG
jgi:hypothetical protein